MCPQIMCTMIPGVNPKLTRKQNGAIDLDRETIPKGGPVKYCRIKILRYNFVVRLVRNCAINIFNNTMNETSTAHVYMYVMRQQQQCLDLTSCYDEVG